MTPGEKQMLSDIIDELEPGRVPLSRAEAKHRMMAVLQPLLAADGYTIQPVDVRDSGVDILAVRPASATHKRQNLVVEIKYRDHMVPVLTLEDIRRFIVIAAVLHDAPRALVVANTMFSSHVHEMVSGEHPFDVQLIGLNDLRAWTSLLYIDPEDIDTEARTIVEDLARRFAELIARDPRALDRMEWRDLERVIAEVFNRLGFDVELTAHAKDGGKDVIVECLVRGRLRSYIVEVKHWRSGKRVGSAAIREFVGALAREARDGGLFLSTYGYAENAFEALTEIERQGVRFGQEQKIAALCRKYTRAGAGLWSPPEVLADVIFEDTE